MEYLSYILLFGLAFYLGFKFNEKIMYLTFSKMLKDAGISNKELDKFINHWAPELGIEREADNDDDRIEIKVERHGEVLYAFRKDNNQFLAQGADIEVLTKIVAERFSDVNFILRSGDGAELVKGNPTS
jgi:nitrous oxide reductase